MSLVPTTFRNAAIGLSAAATLAASAFFPAKAETFAGRSIATGVNPAVCAKYKSDAASHAQCMSNAMDRKIEALKREGAEADKRAASAEDAIACTAYLKAGMSNKDFTLASILAAAGGKMTTEKVCPVARSFGYGKQAQLDKPAVK